MNKLCQMLGIRHPIVQAPMGGAARAELAAAVANAGALGTLPLWTRSVHDLRMEIARMRELTQAPFAVNLNMQFPMERHLDACLELGVQIVSFFWKDPAALVARARSAGATVMYTVGNAEDARRAVDTGVDIIVAQGWEAGGHVRGTVATMALVPAVVDAVGDVPVIAAGGIGDGRGMAAAMALGASGVWAGTRFLVAQEAAVHPRYRARLLGASENDTEHFEGLWDRGWPDAPHRVLRNSTSTRWKSIGCPPRGKRPGEGEVIGHSPASGPVFRYQSHTPGTQTTGDIEAMPMWAGQSVAMARSVLPAAQIVAQFVAQSRGALGAAARELRELPAASRPPSRAMPIPGAAATLSSGKTALRVAVGRP